eukprot:gene6048-6661_t
MKLFGMMVRSMVFFNPRYPLRCMATLFDSRGDFFSPPVQRLQTIFDCLASIPSTVAAAHHPEQEPHLQEALSIMNSMELDDLSINKEAVFGLPYAVALNIANTPSFDITAFVLPKDYCMTLHDHPNMTVCTKLLCGRAQVRAFSEVKRKEGEISARLALDCEKTHRDPAWLLSSSKANFHEIRALEDCVMFDLLLPPYDEERGRRCSFYHALPVGKEDYCLRPFSGVETDSVDLPYTVPYRGFRPEWKKK